MQHYEYDMIIQLIIRTRSILFSMLSIGSYHVAAA